MTPNDNADFAPWSIGNGLIEVCFGMALLFYAGGDVTGFLDVLGLWALLFAMAQAAQAIYSCMGPAFGLGLAGKLIHVLLIGVAKACKSWDDSIIFSQFTVVRMWPATTGISVEATLLCWYSYPVCG